MTEIRVTTLRNALEQISALDASAEVVLPVYDPHGKRWGQKTACAIVAPDCDRVDQAKDRILVENSLEVRVSVSEMQAAVQSVTRQSAYQDFDLLYRAFMELCDGNSLLELEDAARRAPQIVPLAALLRQCRDFPESYLLYVSEQSELTSNTNSAALYRDHRLPETEDPLFATTNGLSYLLGMDDVVQVVENASAQMRKPSAETLVMAVEYYRTHDGFITI